MTVKTESVNHESAISAPIRIHAGPSKRGRKLSDYKRSLLKAAVREVRYRRRMGSSVSVREIAEFHGVAKSTLHRYLRPDENMSDSEEQIHEKENLTRPKARPRPSSYKLSIDFLVDRTNTTSVENNINHNNLKSLRTTTFNIKHALPLIITPIHAKREVALRSPTTTIIELDAET